MINGSVDYKATLLLPERLKSGIATVISTRAADALQLEDGRITVPLRITGTTSNPRVGPDTDVIEEILQDMLREEIGRASCRERVTNAGDGRKLTNDAAV